MQRLQTNARRWGLAGIAAAALLFWWGRGLIALAFRQLFLGLLTALAALPVMKRLEKRLPAGISALLSVACLNAAVAAVLFVLLPALAGQVRQLLTLLPELWQGMEQLIGQAESWLVRHGGTAVRPDIQSAVVQRGQELLGSAASAALGLLRGAADSISQWLLAPVFGFYFLRDRRMISAWLLRFLPVSWREPSVRVLREMRRETAGYLRGQLMVSAIVGGLTAAGLLLCGTPAWLALGAAMGILELIPYVGPAAGCVLISLFTLPQGLWRTLWALGIALAVQQAEGSVLAPRLISQTTRLHPAAVILCVLLGGWAAGVAGILLAVPLVLCLRAALRVLIFYLPRTK